MSDNTGKGATKKVHIHVVLFVLSLFLSSFN